MKASIAISLVIFFACIYWYWWARSALKATSNRVSPPVLIEGSTSITPPTGQAGLTDLGQRIPFESWILPEAAPECLESDESSEDSRARVSGEQMEELGGALDGEPEIHCYQC